MPSKRARSRQTSVEELDDVEEPMDIPEDQDDDEFQEEDEDEEEEEDEEAASSPVRRSKALKRANKKKRRVILGSDDEVPEDDDGDDENLPDVDDEDDDEAGDDNESASSSSSTSRQNSSRRGEKASNGSGRGRGRPRGRGRGRGGSTRGTRGRGRGRGRGKLSNGASRPRNDDDDDDDDEDGDVQPVHTGVAQTRLVNDKEYLFVDDELVLDDDEKGDEKIDALGNLLGGREFKAYTFCSPYRAQPTKRYIMSIDAARACGYKDSLYFFRRNKELVKLSMSNTEKELLIQNGTLTASMRSRTVTIIGVRNCFKVQGCKLIKDGHWVTDDYYEKKALADCAENGVEPYSAVGELPDPFADDKPQAPKQVAKLSVTAPFYVPGGPTTHWGGNGLQPFGGLHVGHANKKTLLQRAGLTEENWMYEYAKAAVERNKEYLRDRQSRMERFTEGEGFMYEPQPGELEGLAAEDAEAAARAASEVDDDGVAQRKFPKLEKGKGREGSMIDASTPGGYSEGGLDTSAAVTENGDLPLTALPLRQKWRPGPPVGFYEPHTQMPLVPRETQPTRAVVERLSELPDLAPFEPKQSLQPAIDPSLYGLDGNEGRKPLDVLQVFGGSRVGTRAWGISSISYEMDLHQV